MSLFTLLPFQGSVTLLLAYSILLAVTSAMPPHRARWCDMVDSDDEGQAAPPRRNLTFPFYLVLNVFLDGLFNPRISVRSMEVLQARLQADGRVRSLHPVLQDIVLHMAFRRGRVRRQVRAFMATLLQNGASPSALRRWQAWLRLQCWYDPPVYCCRTYAAVYTLQL